MKKTIILSCIFCFTILSSCKKCITCEVKNAKGAIVFTYPENCGARKDMKDYENDLKESFSKTSNTVHCR